MLKLKPRPRNVSWKTIELGDGVSLEVQLTPPSYEDFLTERIAVTTAEAALLRLNCITDWRGVIEATDDGEQRELPFSRDGLSSLIVQFESAFERLLAAVRPLFSPVTEDREKKSAAPPAAATSPTLPSNDSLSSGDSPNSAASSV